MSTPFLPSLLIFGLICVALVVAGEHKRIYYERTLDRYTSESRVSEGNDGSPKRRYHERDTILTREVFYPCDHDMKLILSFSCSYLHVHEQKQIMNKNIMIGNCVERESDTGMIRLCLNLNNTFALSTHDVWVVQNEDKRILSPSFSGNA